MHLRNWSGLPRACSAAPCAALRNPQRFVGLTGQNANQRNVDSSEVYDVEAAPKAHIRTVNQRQIRLTNTQILDLVAARLSGLTIEQLADQFGIHQTTVMRHLKRNENARHDL